MPPKSKKCSAKQTVLCAKKDCDVCNPRRFINYKGKTDNGTLIKSLWDEEKNGQIPFTLHKGAGKKFYFKCDNPDCKYHSYLVTPYNFTTLGTKCPYCCKHSRTLCDHPDCKYCYKRSFASSEKRINKIRVIDCWNTKKNGDITPRNIFKNTSTYYYFDCNDCDHSFKKSISLITDDKNPSWCQYCAGKQLCGDINCNDCFQKSFASCEELTPSGNKMVDQWDYSRNFTEIKEEKKKRNRKKKKGKKDSKKKEVKLKKINPHEVFKCATTRYYFKCDKCTHSFDVELNSISSRNIWCGYCSSNRLCEDVTKCEDCFKKVFASFDEKTRFGSLKLDGWDKIKNGKNTPLNTFKGSRTKIHFICPDCNTSFSKISHLVTGEGKQWCWHCSTKTTKFCDNDKCKLCFNKSFASYDEKTQFGNPKIDCWDYDKNVVSPTKLLKGSTEVCWFICDNPDCGHSFRNSVGSITLNVWCQYCCLNSWIFCDDNSCDICLRKSFLSTDIKTPSGTPIMNCWDYKKNDLDPRYLSRASSKECYFICDECKESIKKPLYDVARGGWCGKCFYKTEKKLHHWLRKTYPNYTIKYQVKFDFCRSKKSDQRLPYDYCIKELDLIIELDGDQHFRQVANWSDPQSIFQRDKRKMAKLIKNGYSIIRIYQMDVFKDKNNWDQQLKKAIQKYKIPTIKCIDNPHLYKKFNKLNISQKYLVES